MEELVPIYLYIPVHYIVMLLVVLLTFAQSQSNRMDSDSNFRYMKGMGVVYFLFVVLFMGLRPVSGSYFGDMSTYRDYFNHYANGGEIFSRVDLLFHLYTQACSKVLSLHTYFLLCATIYMWPLVLVSKKWFKDYWFYGFLFLVTSFSFWTYGTNGIRNGMAGSLLLLGISRDKRLWQVVLIVLAVSFHKSMVLPAAAFVFANFYNNPKKLMYLWLLCIPASLVAGGAFESFFATLGFDDDRINYLTQTVDATQFENTGFRWDFLLYSATGVFAGWFYIFKRNYKDKVYFWLFNTYILTNAFWILVIRANYSNRFAYLSWFMISLVIVYPLLKQYIIAKQHKKIGLILLAYFSFTLFMNLLLII